MTEYLFRDDPYLAEAEAVVTASGPQGIELDRTIFYASSGGQPGDTGTIGRSAVTGTVHPDGIWRKSDARPGDAVFLTKPLGTGLILQAAREGRVLEGSLEAAVDAMCESGRDAADALRSFPPNAVTDVTGFGLLGHVHETAVRSGVRIVLDAAALPALPGAIDLARSGIRTGGDRRNRAFAGAHVTSSASDELEALAYDPQTAGGMLVTLPAAKRAVLEATFADAGLPLHAVGRVEEGSGVALVAS